MCKKSILILTAIFFCLALLSAHTEGPWSEVTIPFNFSFPEMEFTGAGLELMFYSESPHFGMGVSFVFGKNSYMTLNAGYLGFLPLLEEMAVPITIRAGFYADDFYTRDENLSLGFSAAAGLKLALIRSWDTRINLHSMLEIKYDLTTFTEEFSFDTLLADFKEYEYLQLSNGAGGGGFKGGSSGSYYYTTYTYYY